MVKEELSPSQAFGVRGSASRQLCGLSPGLGILRCNRRPHCRFPPKALMNAAVSMGRCSIMFEVYLQES